jgi:hypothetical protein
MPLDDPKELHEIILPQQPVQEVARIPEPMQDQVPAVVAVEKSLALPHKAEKVGLGNPLRKQPLITPAMEERIKRKETKQKERTAKKKLLKEQAEHAKQEQLAPVEAIVKETPPQLQPYGWQKGVSGNPSGRPRSRPMKDAAEKVFLAPSTGEDANQLERALRLIKDKMIGFLQSKDLDVDDLHVLIQDMEIIATRLEGKPGIVEGETSGDKTLTINIATRFSPAAPSVVEPNKDVITVEAQSN